MLRELLPDVQQLVPAPVDRARRRPPPETTQFDMVRAFVMLAKLPVLPFHPDWRLDIVPVDYVSKAIVTLHQRDKLAHDAYSLSSGTASLTYRQVVERHAPRRPPGQAPLRPRPQRRLQPRRRDRLQHPRGWGLSLPASLLKVFLPYLTFDTVFDNRRVVDALGESPAPFDRYAYGLYRFAIGHNFSYPYQPWPGGAQVRQVA